MDTLRVTGAADVAYVRANYVDLESACREAGYDPVLVADQIAAGERPGPAYVLADGSRFVPRDYFGQLTDERLFAERALAHARLRGLSLEPERLRELWDFYLEGVYGICLRHATPELIVDKQWLVASIEALLRAPLVGDPDWYDRLHEAVDALDAIEREFCAFDRIRFGRPVTRDTYITAVRKSYPRGALV